VTATSRTYINAQGWVVLDLIFDAEAQHDRRQLIIMQETTTTRLFRSINSQSGQFLGANVLRGMDSGDVRAIENHFRTSRREAGFTELQWNQLIRETNRRAELVLRDVIGIHDHTGPEEWWQWWDDFNEYHATGTKPLLRVQPDPERQYVTRESKQVTNQPPPHELHSCLVAGTPVWTEQGSLPIEQIQIGDRVLAQNADSGELAYKPVLKTTLRAPARTFRISCEGIELRATGGHPFWVNGAGWRFARDLQPGMSLHGVDGAQVIRSVEPAAEAEAFNLIVADFHTYFIGGGEILSHDNTPRAPTNALVPGLNREP
jgi:hypothetical protein